MRDLARLEFQTIGVQIIAAPWREDLAFREAQALSYAVKVGQWDEAFHCALVAVAGNAEIGWLVTSSASVGSSP